MDLVVVVIVVVVDVVIVVVVVVVVMVGSSVYKRKVSIDSLPLYQHHQLVSHLFLISLSTIVLKRLLSLC